MVVKSKRRCHRSAYTSGKQREESTAKRGIWREGRGVTEIESLVEKVLSASCERHEIIAPCYSAPLSPPLKPVLLLSLFPIILPRRKHTHTRICALVCCCFLLMTQACHIFSGYLVDGGGRSTSGAFFDGDSWRNREASVNGRDVAHQEDLVPPPPKKFP